MPKFPVKVIRNGSVVSEANQIEAEEGKHKWTWNEELLCCKECIEEYVVKKADTKYSVVIQRISRRLPTIQANSIKMKLQNIKALFEKKGIENTLDIGPLDHWSPLNEDALELLLNNRGLN